MNKQRKVLITTAYNEMGIIIDTKVEEIAQLNLQPICNQLATDTISRPAALEVLEKIDCSDGVGISSLKCDVVDDAVTAIKALPSVDAVPVVRCKGCKYWDAFPSSTLAPDHHECKRIWIHTTAEWFCAAGERKDGDGNG